MDELLSALELNRHVWRESLGIESFQPGEADSLISMETAANTREESAPRNESAGEREYNRGSWRILETKEDDVTIPIRGNTPFPSFDASETVQDKKLREKLHAERIRRIGADGLVDREGSPGRDGKEAQDLTDRFLKEDVREEISWGKGRFIPSIKWDNGTVSSVLAISGQGYAEADLAQNTAIQADARNRMNPGAGSGWMEELDLRSRISTRRYPQDIEGEQ